MLTFILVLVAGICNSIMDVLSFKFINSIFAKGGNWINPLNSWKNKWKNGDPKQGERFLFSSTALVFLTDLWHLCKFIMLMCLCLGIVFYKPIFGIWDFILFYCLFTFTFELFYSYILIKKQ